MINDSWLGCIIIKLLTSKSQTSIFCISSTCTHSTYQHGSPANCARWTQSHSLCMSWVYMAGHGLHAFLWMWHVLADGTNSCDSRLSTITSQGEWTQTLTCSDSHWCFKSIFATKTSVQIFDIVTRIWWVKNIKEQNATLSRRPTQT